MSNQAVNDLEMAAKNLKTVGNGIQAIADFMKLTDKEKLAVIAFISVCLILASNGSTSG